MSANIFIQATCPAGAKIKGAAEEAVQLADRTWTPVTFDFNGIGMYAYPSEYAPAEYRVNELVKYYEERINSNSIERKMRAVKERISGS